MNVVQAVETGDLGRVQELVLNDPQHVFYQDDYGRTALEVAVKDHHLEATKFLLQHGAIQCEDHGGVTPIIYTIRNWEGLAMLDLLLEYGANPTDRTKPTEHNTLMIAILKNKHDQVARLLRHPAILSNLDARNKGRETALWIASNQDDAETVMLLLQAGADPTITDGAGRTARSMVRSKTCVDHFEVMSAALTCLVLPPFLPDIPPPPRTRKES